MSLVAGVEATAIPLGDADPTALEQGAAAGDTQSMFDLGVALYHGLSCPPDVPAALQWWWRGAEAGHVRCKLRLADALQGEEAHDTVGFAMIGQNFIACAGCAKRLQDTPRFEHKS